MEEFFRLLDDLHVCAKDLDDEAGWIRLLLDTITSPEGIQYLSYSYWELLMEFALCCLYELKNTTYSSHIIQKGGIS